MNEIRIKDNYEKFVDMMKITFLTNMHTRSTGITCLMTMTVIQLTVIIPTNGSLRRAATLPLERLLRHKTRSQRGQITSM